MERLTDNSSYCTSWTDCPATESRCKVKENCYDRKMYEKLRFYEDLEEHLEKVYGEHDGLLETVVKSLVKYNGEKPRKSRLLTDGDADKWEMYKDAEEQGLLLRLPCKVGDTIYKIWYKPCHHGEDHPDSYGCCGCEDDCDLEKTIFEFVVPGLEWVLNHFNVFGNYIWFLTREEAEAALAEMER